GSRAWVAWYTEADGAPELRLAVSDDAGDSFAAPVTLARGPQVLGRVALAADGRRLHVAWLEQASATTQRLRLARYPDDLPRAEAIEVASFPARGDRKSTRLNSS